MRISQLEGRRIALWGWGREGRAAYRALRARLPSQPLTLFCAMAEIGDAAAFADPLLAFETDASGEKLARFEVVVKSPGISPYGEAARFARARGTDFIGGTRLWFSERGENARTLCVTGTKGKSTTTALLAHLLRAAGHRTALAGNIGLPLLELLDARAEAWAIELSSYQTRDVADSGVRPALAIVTNLFPEHLDWHGGESRYVEDKLALLTQAAPSIAVLNANDPVLSKLELPASDVRWYGTRAGWHLRGDGLFRGERAVLDTRDLPLPGRHNRGNLCAVLTALDALGFDAAALARHAATFAPLPNRLQSLGVREGVRWVNDSISTTPHASLAALDVHAGEKVVLLVGGHDRGLDWHGFAEAMETRAPHGIVTMGANGPRIHDLLAPMAAKAGFELRAARDLPGAVAIARELLAGDGVLLLSPGAPSFGAYGDYVARGRHFAELGGFDPEIISAIAGLGIA
ncbi:UDP-N-acetylmuramoyl-L-alanine--D-glutamate ligase [Lysobacter pythonis]|uniref:UDP-N-acetylmuramoyl-L-alanine--L-glutamate ligase n=1 Tax=Solilutibacter pythonis TaxID=2483112 RepID=A0A3M2I4C9_9GAMM|nr:UDP-N-acetylmuramoyl-L-alanine--D-glutamate ligase [Lysobacter pythonis]RMH94082.1 UDP-N-acetylmuramoyl-L-alanine--D-glutamate ligase [Lysobacter pythonis]